MSTAEDAANMQRVPESGMLLLCCIICKSGLYRLIRPQICTKYQMPYLLFTLYHLM